jgi:hypothetical protein
MKIILRKLKKLSFSQIENVFNCLSEEVQSAETTPNKVEVTSSNFPLLSYADM